MPFVQACLMFESHGFHLVLRPGADQETDVYAQEIIDLSKADRKTPAQVKKEAIRLGTLDSLVGKRHEDICVDLIDSFEEVLKGRKSNVVQS